MSDPSLEDVVREAITEGVRLAMVEHLRGKPDLDVSIHLIPTGTFLPPSDFPPEAPVMAVQAPPTGVSPVGVPTPPAMPPRPPMAPPRPETGVKNRVPYTVVTSTQYGPTPSSDHVYLAFTLQNEQGEKVMLKFLRSATGETAVKWDDLLETFLDLFEIGPVADTVQLHGLTVDLIKPAEYRATVAGLDTVGEMLGVSL